MDYFCHGVADSFENVKKRAQEAADTGAADESPQLRKLDPRQRKALELFLNSEVITSRDVQTLFAISQRTARNLLAAWAENGFVVVLDSAKKTRKYGIAGEFKRLILRN